jgi:hypothetical protein
MALKAPVNETEYFNATSVCQRYGRRLVDWRRLPSTQRLIKTFEANHKIAVPTQINGMEISEGAYHVGIYVTDTSGNESQVFLEIHIEDDHGDDHDH